MVIIKETVELIFSVALFINALLFIPQSVRILKEKTAKGVSFVTFMGLLLIQFAIVLHGIITHDTILILGYVVSMITTGSVVMLIFIYRNKTSSLQTNNIDLNDI